MNLDSTLLKLEAVLGGSVSANQPEAIVNYTVWNIDAVESKPATFRTALNSTTDVTILAAPGTQGLVNEVKRVSIYNKDTASVTVTVKTDDATTERIICKTTLLTLETLNFEKGQGWYAVDANGNRKEVTASVFSSLTVTGNATVGGTLVVTGTFSASNVLSGTYTPTITNGTNVASSTTRLAGYMRVGNEVTVEGQFDIDPTATGATNWTISLPVATNFATSTTGCGGAGASTLNASVYIEAEPATDTAIFIMTASSANSQTISYSFTYRVI